MRTSCAGSKKTDRRRCSTGDTLSHSDANRRGRRASRGQKGAEHRGEGTRGVRLCAEEHLESIRLLSEPFLRFVIDGATLVDPFRDVQRIAHFAPRRDQTTVSCGHPPSRAEWAGRAQDNPAPFPPWRGRCMLNRAPVPLVMLRAVMHCARGPPDLGSHE